MTSASRALAVYAPPVPMLLDPEELFEATGPAAGQPLAELFAEYDRNRAEIEQVSAYATGALGRVYSYFCTGNGDGSGELNRTVASRLFQADGAYRALDAAYWRRALDLTDVLQHMTGALRDQWRQTIDTMQTAPFVPATVVATLADLLARRADLLAERVDAIFRRLSGEHVTNRPQGFSTRMILRWVHSAGFVRHDGDVGAISDLRSVVAKFMGRAEPAWHTSSRIVSIALERSGEWIDLDGGALRLRVYRKGTGHLEVHPEMAWRLNAILAHRYPRAIAAAERTRPAKPRRAWTVLERPLPTAVLDLLAQLRRVSRHEPERWELRADAGPARDEAVAVLEALGARVTTGFYTTDVRFPYPAVDVVRDLVSRGALPDQVSHQYYPTPTAIADRVIELAGPIEPGELVLEPSAGQGALADRLAAAGAAVTCVELAELHAAVLRAKGHHVVAADFLDWPAGDPGYRLVVMNPPFSDGRWQAHVRHAATMVREGGRLVAVLPDSARRGLDLGPGWSVTWSPAIEGAFPGVSVTVTVLVADRVAAAEGRAA